MPHLSPLVLVPSFAAFVLFIVQSYRDDPHTVWTPNLMLAVLSVGASVSYIVAGIAGLLTRSAGIAFTVLAVALLAGAATEAALRRSL